MGSSDCDLEKQTNKKPWQYNSFRGAHILRNIDFLPLLLLSLSRATPFSASALILL